MSYTSEQVGSGDAQSPTTLILNYLKSKGIQPSGGNIRTALEEGYRNPGLIPGLINDRPATDAEDQAAMLNKAMAPRGNTGPIQDQSNTASAPGETAPGSGEPKTSAAPSPSGSGMDKLIATAGLLAPSIASAILGNRNPTPGGSVPALPDVAANVPQIGSPDAVARLGGPDDMRLLPPPDAATPMESAMQRAIAAPQQQITGPQDVTTPRANPPDVVPLPDESIPEIKVRARKPSVRVRAPSVRIHG